MSALCRPGWGIDRRDATTTVGRCARPGRGCARTPYRRLLCGSGISEACDIDQPPPVGASAHPAPAAGPFPAEGGGVGD